MNLKCIVAVLALSVLSWGASAETSVPKVTVKSQLASPVVLENSQEKNYLKVSLVGYPQAIEKRSPINLALVIDRSGSMSGERIVKAREAAIAAVNMLDSRDTLSVVAYDTGVEVVLPATRVNNKPQIIETIMSSITPRGSTALFAGVSKGIDQVSKHLNKERINRIILLSDGQANVGPISNGELAELARIAAKNGIAITTFGIGEDYNEDLMTTIASYSDGNHRYIKDAKNLESALAHEFSDVMSVVAQDIEVVITTANQVTPVRLLGRDGDIRGNKVTVKLNQLYANQEKYVLLEVLPAKGRSAETKPLAAVNVRYANLGTKQVDTVEEKIAISYSQSSKEVSSAQVDDVIVDSAIQKAALENDRAIKLMDEGKMAEAREVLNNSVESLNTLEVAAPQAREKAQASVRKNQMIMDDMKSESQASSRKAVKEQIYNMKTQKNP